MTDRIIMISVLLFSVKDIAHYVNYIVNRQAGNLMLPDICYKIECCHSQNWKAEPVDWQLSKQEKDSEKNVGNGK